MLPCFLFFSNLFGLLLLPLANFAVFKFALTLGFFPSALINGGLSKGFTIGSSFTSSTMSLSSMKGAAVVTVMENLPGLSGVGEGKEEGVDWWRCCCRRLDFTRGLALKGRLVVVKPRGIGAGVEPEKGAGVVAEKGGGGGPLMPGAGRGRGRTSSSCNTIRIWYRAQYSAVQCSTVQYRAAVRGGGWRHLAIISYI